MDEVTKLSPTERNELEFQLAERVEEAGTLIDALLTPARLSPAALDRRRLGLPPESYEELVDPLGEALLRALWDRAGDIEPIWEEMAQGLYTMADTAREADLAGIPAATAAQVMGVTELEATGSSNSGGAESGLLAVHLEAPMPVDYLPGQSLPVLVPGPYGERGEWHELTPALPSNRFGQLVFYVPTWWRCPEVGEYWTCGNARGEQFVFPDQGEVDATGSRLAGVRAAVLGGVDKRVELVVDVREPALTSLAGAVDWLTLREV
ncbi:ferredoxin reductase domain-containing protein [Corynebacterium urinipleomorphum]|uniref:hypothetical protein n=1 Tax=Corynebacterium urinipleomorphum TaxID=1852380 RepID=UPI000B35832F|nr:hypothetical protein [Corynebacterium urinipleomorphum]